MINVIAWVIAIAAWLVIVLAPVALVGLAVVPSWRRWWLRPLLRRVTGRRPELVAARTGVLELEAYGVSELASAFPPEYRHMAGKRCAVCGGPLGYPFATSRRGNECRSCAGMTNTGGTKTSGLGWSIAYDASAPVGRRWSIEEAVAPSALHLDDCSRPTETWKHAHGDDDLCNGKCAVHYST